jgi:phosphatidylglycerol:prolipoprotein diacylglycerol transferase
VDNRAARRRAAAEAKHRKSRSGTSVRPGTDAIAQKRPPEAADLEALVVSHMFASGEDGAPFSATVRLTGRRTGVDGPTRPQDTFTQEDQIEGITPGSGPVSVTSWVYGLEPGEWTVNAELVRTAEEGAHGRRALAEPLARAAWSWRRRALSTSSASAIKTRWAMIAPLASVPGVVRGSWAALGVLAAVVALLVQGALVGYEGVPMRQSLVVSLIALASGMVGAKLWYAVLHPGPWRQALLGGWAVDGFLVVAPVVAIASLLASELPVGAFMDAATPGLFFAVAIGRVGCFFTGCCAGRLTRSRWGIWSSDRRVGARRVPAQLIESAAGLLLGGTALALVLGKVSPVSGAIFVSAFVLYVLVRQALLRVRAERREFSWRRRDPAATKRS